MSGGVTTDGLPAGWAWSTVGEVGDVKLGRQRSPEHHTGLHMRPYLRVANVYEARIDLADVLEMNFTPEEYETYRLLHGDILLNEGQSLEYVGRPAMFRDELPGACFQNTLVRFRAKPAVEPAFALLIFRYYLHSHRFQKIARWTVNIAHLGASRLAELEFPVPPLAEQRRIVAKVEELFADLDAGVAALERVRANLKRYRAAVLKAAVEGRLTADWRAAHPDAEPASALLARILADRRAKWEADQRAKFAAAGKPPPKNWQAKYAEPTSPGEVGKLALPEGWCWVTLGQMLHRIEAGKSFECLTRRADPNEWGIIKVSAMTWGEFDEAENKAVPSGKAIEQSTEIRAGDILLSRSNTSELVGATVLVRACRPKLLLSDKSMRLVPSDCIDRAWLQRAMSSAVARRQLSAVATGTSDSMRNVSQQKVEDVLIPLPPLAEQAAIVEAVEVRLSVAAVAERQVAADLARAVRLRQAILKRAFAGLLVPQDPADEPAAALLERIRQSRSAPPSTPRGAVGVNGRRGRKS